MSKALNNLTFHGDYVPIDNGKIYAQAVVSEAPYSYDHIVKIDADTHSRELVYDRPVIDNPFSHSFTTNTPVLCNGKLVTSFSINNIADQGETLTA